MPFKSKLKLIRGYIRYQIFHVCPKCQSKDIDKWYCNVCDNYQYYPNHVLLNQWWTKYKEVLNAIQK